MGELERALTDARAEFEFAARQKIMTLESWRQCAANMEALLRAALDRPEPRADDEARPQHRYTQAARIAERICYHHDIRLESPQHRDIRDAIMDMAEHVYTTARREAAQAEREARADIADDWPDDVPYTTGIIAMAIRARESGS